LWGSTEGLLFQAGRDAKKSTLGYNRDMTRITLALLTIFALLVIAFDNGFRIGAYGTNVFVVVARIILMGMAYYLVTRDLRALWRFGERK
jgi:uncharacterized membrane protein YqjE